MWTSEDGPGGLLRTSHRPADADAVLDTTVAGILLEAAVDRPDELALVEGVPDTGLRRRWTYAELLRDVQGAASALSERFTPGERVAVWAPSVPESLMLTYAAAMAKLVLVPVNPLLRDREVAFIVGQCSAAGLFYVDEHRGVGLGAAIERIRGELPFLREVVSIGGWDEFTAGAGSSPSHDDMAREGASPDVGFDGASPDDVAYDGPSPDDVAQLVYTSGTTGSPKGALLTHRGMTNAARFGALRFGLRPGDVYVDTMPLCHVGGQVVAFQICQRRAAAILVKEFEPGLVLELIESERASIAVGVPTMLLSLVEHPDFSRRDLSSLRSVSSGGSVVPAELIRDIESRLGVQCAVVFGQTEACGFISQTELDDSAEDKASTLGKPLPGVEARVVEVDSRAVVSPGEAGELEIRGYNVTRGYHDRPSETRESISSDGWLRTGDLVTMDERGYLRFVGRTKDMIVRGGENIYPAEVEAVLCQHPDVSAAAVIGLPDRLLGEVPVAVVRPSPGRSPTGPELESWAREHMARFKVPRRWQIVEEFPMTVSGKVKKFVLKDLLTNEATVEEERHDLHETGGARGGC